MIQRHFSIVALTLTAVLMGGAQSAFAYKSAVVQSDSAAMKQSASDDAPTVATLPKGTRVNTSDNPTSGYYRARSASASGWLKDSDITFDMSSAPPPPKTKTTARRRPPKREQPLDYKWTLSAFGGFDFWSTSQINSVIQTSSLNTGGGYGAEFGYRFNRNWFWLFRVEHLSKSVSGFDASGQVPIATSVSSTPLMTGLQYHFADSGSWSFDFGALLGLALGTQFSLDTANDGYPDIYKATPITALLKFEVNYRLFESLWLFAEPGYRILSTSQFSQPTTSTNASSQTNGYLGDFTALNINLSGPVLNLGARLNF